MTASRNPDDLIQAFLAEGQTDLPDRAFDAVRSEIHRTRQRAVIGPWRSPDMSTLTRVAAAVAAVIAIAVVGLNLAPRPSDVNPSQSTPPVVTSSGATPGVSSSPSASATSSATAIATSPGAGVSNGWIAFSTMPGRFQVNPTDDLQGGDLYLVREGVEPRLIAGREDGTTRNVCPAFSPDGSKLAFGTASPNGRAVVVLTVNPDGSTSSFARISLSGVEPAVCPRWSSDGTRVGYPDGGAFIIRGLDGSATAPAAGDPTPVEVDENEPLVSPSGELVAKEGVEVSNIDGSEARTVYSKGWYSIAAWSPDNRMLLIYEDVSGIHFTMHAVSVDSPFDQVDIVSRVRLNGGRSFPGRGDVSWQPVFP